MSLTDLQFLDPEGLVNRAAFNQRFGKLNELYRYWWKRRLDYDGSSQYVEKHTSETKNDPYDMNNYFFLCWNISPTGLNITYAASISINQETGAVSLANPITENFANLSITDVNKKLLGKYVINCPEREGIVDYIMPNATIEKVTYDSEVEGNWAVTDIKNGVRQVSSEIYTDHFTGEWEYLFSDDRNAYPDGGKEGNYEYQYLGIPFDNAVEAPKIATGSYVGTGTYGEGNPNTLTFEFDPKLLIVQTDSDSYPAGFVWVDGISMIGCVFTGTSSSASLNISISKDGEKITWYSSDGSVDQMNISAQTYYYTAIG